MELQAVSQMLVKKFTGANPAAEQAADKLSTKIAEAPSGLGRDQLLLANRSSAVPAAARSFDYRGMQFPDLSAAREWTPDSEVMSGTEANRIVTQSYHQLDQAFTAYLGTPDVSNWLTFGKYASHEVGTQISELEGALMATKLDAAGFKRLLDDTSLGTVRQGFKAFKAEGGHYEQILDQRGVLGSLDAQLGFPSYMLSQLTDLRNSLVAGNTKIYSDVVPAYDTFLKAEASGQDGLQALKAIGYGQGARDPQGFILKSFAGYKEAKRVGLSAEQPGLSSDERKALLDRRRDLIAQANLDMGINEQMTILQAPNVFGNPAVARLTDAMTGTMRIRDAFGSHDLLPDGGKWSDFATRMGFSEVPSGTVTDPIRVRDHQNGSHEYVLPPDSERPGTISAYFENNLTSEVSKRLISFDPSQLSTRS